MSDKEASGALVGKHFQAQIVKVFPPTVENKTYKFQIRIPPIHQGLTDSELPFAILQRRLFLGSGDGIGWFSIPRVGSSVLVTCDGGDEKSLYIVSEPFGKNALISGFNEKDYGFKDASGNVLKVTENGSFSYNGVNNIDISNTTGNIVIKSAGCTVTLDASGLCSIVAGDQITLEASTVVVEGDLVVNGSTTLEDFTASGGGEVNGGISVNDGLSIDGADYFSHTHGGVQTGGDNTQGVNP